MASTGEATGDATARSGSGAGGATEDVVDTNWAVVGVMIGLGVLGGGGFGMVFSTYMEGERLVALGFAVAGLFALGAIAFMGAGFEGVPIEFMYGSFGAFILSAFVVAGGRQLFTMRGSAGKKLEKRLTDAKRLMIEDGILADSFRPVVERALGNLDLSRQEDRDTALRSKNGLAEALKRRFEYFMEDEMGKRFVSHLEFADIFADLDRAEGRAVDVFHKRLRKEFDAFAENEKRQLQEFGDRSLVASERV